MSAFVYTSAGMATLNERGQRDAAVHVEQSNVVVNTSSVTLSESVEQLLPEVAAARGMWELDQKWFKRTITDRGLGTKPFVDARLCIAGTSRPYDSTCAGNSFCDWGYWTSDIACSPAVFESMMFQSTRYTWAQAQLAILLAQQPPSVPDRNARSYATTARAWADWCFRVMRLVSVARWSTNISAYYLPQFAQWSSDGGQRPWVEHTIDWHFGPRTAEALLGIMRDLEISRGVTGGPPGSIASSKWLVSMFKPIDHNTNFISGERVGSRSGLADAKMRAEIAPPLAVDGFNPYLVPIVDTSGASYVMDWYQQGGQWKYPTRETGLGGLGTTVLARMGRWFEHTLGLPGTWLAVPGVWVNTHRHRGAVSVGQDSVEVTKTLETVYYGKAQALIKLCTAWATDVVEENYGRAVAVGMGRYLDHMAAIPENQRLTGMTNSEIEQTRSGLTEVAMNEAIAVTSSVGGIAGGLAAAIPVVGWVAGLVVGLATAIISGLTAMLQATGNAAIGGALLKCPPPPLVRMLADDATNACDFDHRVHARGEGREGLVIVKTDTLFDVAASGHDVATWFDAAEFAEGESEPLEDLADLSTTPPPSESRSGSPNTKYLVAGGLVIGGAALLKYLRKG